MKIRCSCTATSICALFIGGWGVRGYWCTVRRPPRGVCAVLWFCGCDLTFPSSLQLVKSPHIQPAALIQAAFLGAWTPCSFEPCPISSFTSVRGFSVASMSENEVTKTEPWLRFFFPTFPQAKSLLSREAVSAWPHAPGLSSHLSLHSLSRDLTQLQALSALGLSTILSIQFHPHPQEKNAPWHLTTQKKVIN